VSGARRNPWRDARPALPARRPGVKRPLHSARFYRLLPAEPTILSEAAAREYWLACDTWLHASIPLLMQHGIVGGWDKHERANLTRLTKRWERRAQGLDARWLRVGTRRGGYHGSGLTRDQVDPGLPRDVDPAWSDAGDEN